MATKKELKELGFSFPDSKTNFLFATHEKVPAVELFEALRKENIFVPRYCGFVSCFCCFDKKEAYSMGTCWISSFVFIIVHRGRSPLIL